MPVEGSNHHPAPDDAAGQERAERQLAGVAELVLAFVSLYVTEIITLPQFSPLSTYLHDTIMAWATEALDHPGQPPQRRTDSDAVAGFDLKRLVELCDQDARLQANLAHAREAIAATAGQLANAKPDSQAWYAAKQALHQALTHLGEVSAQLMQHDAVRADGPQDIERIQQQMYRDDFVSATVGAGREAAPASPDPERRSRGITTRAALDPPAASEGPRYIHHPDRTVRWELGDPDPEDPALGPGGAAPTPGGC